jgi:GntR family transcriptional regulator, trehalose operon transcriptional repressor
VVSKFHTIYNEIADQIRQGEFPPRTTLPSENELCEQYQASRETIRKALNLLAQNGFIQKIQGKGSIVLDVTKLNFPIGGLVSFKELASQMGKQWRTIVYDFGLIKPDSFIQNQLHISPKDYVWKIIRAREIEQEKIILDKDYINKKIVPTLTKDICENSIYEYLEKELGLKISFAKKEIAVEELTNEDREYLDVEGFVNIVVVRSYVYLEDTSLLQYTESRHRPDKFRFTDFARRR